MGAIQNVITAVNTILETQVTNAYNAYDYPVEQIVEERSYMTYYGGGSLEMQTYDFYKGLHTFVVDFVVFRKDLARDMQLLMTDIDTVFSALSSDPTFGGKISTFEQITCSQPIAETWGGVPVFILRFTIENAKILT